MSESIEVTVDDDAYYHILAQGKSLTDLDEFSFDNAPQTVPCVKHDGTLIQSKKLYSLIIEKDGIQYIPEFAATVPTPFVYTNLSASDRSAFVTLMYDYVLPGEYLKRIHAIRNLPADISIKRQIEQELDEIASEWERVKTP